MRSTWLMAVVGCIGCTGPNPAFLAGSAGGSEGATGPSSGAGTEGSGGSTTRPGTDTEVSPTTGVGETATGALSVGETTTTTGETTGGTEALSVGETTTGGESSGVGETLPESSTGIEPNSTGVDASICGDGIQEGDELCDAGPDPLPVPGGCLPTCDGTIPEKLIFAGGAITGDFAFNGGLAVADEKCAAIAEEYGLDGTFKAVISDGVNRIAAKAPYDPTGGKDWPLHPYTAYVNPSNNVVWVTGKIPLLGVVPSPNPMLPNQPMPLMAPINVDMVPLWTGMASNWVTGKTCGQWKDINSFGTAGWAHPLTGFLDALGDISCQKTYGFICAEQ